jgi:hypothetical protein
MGRALVDVVAEAEVNVTQSTDRGSLGRFWSLNFYQAALQRLSSLHCLFTSYSNIKVSSAQSLHHYPPHL